MSTRERWIVYPLLFLALGVALRDKVIPPDPFKAYALKVHEITAEQIRCNGVVAGQIECHRLEADQAECRELQTVLAACRVLTVAGPRGDDGVRMGFVNGKGGQIEVCGAGGKVVALIGTDRDGRAGLVETVPPGQEP